MRVLFSLRSLVSLSKSIIEKQTSVTNSSSDNTDNEQDLAGLSWRHLYRPALNCIKKIFAIDQVHPSQSHSKEVSRKI